MGFTQQQVDELNSRALRRCPIHVRRNHACHICARISQELMAPLELDKPVTSNKNISCDYYLEPEVPNAIIERDKAAALVKSDAGKEKSVHRTRVRFSGYRVRPLDPDNFAGSVKDLLDGLRHAGLIPGDEPWQIILETDQEKVAHFSEEKTVIVIDDGAMP